MVANRFVRLAQEKGETITIMQLVKFVYLAHGWHWGYYDKPLIRHNVEAWKYGPPEVYNAFRPQGIIVVSPALCDGDSSAVPYEAVFSSKANKLIDGVFDAYAKISAYALSALTHEEGTPWDQVKNKGFYAPIPDEIIRDYYHKKVQADS